MKIFWKESPLFLIILSIGQIDYLSYRIIPNKGNGVTPMFFPIVPSFEQRETNPYDIPLYWLFIGILVMFYNGSLNLGSISSPIYSKKPGFWALFIWPFPSTTCRMPYSWIASVAPSCWSAPPRRNFSSKTFETPGGSIPRWRKSSKNNFVKRLKKHKHQRMESECKNPKLKKLHQNNIEWLLRVH